MQSNITNIIAAMYHPYAYESITVSSTAVGFTASNIDQDNNLSGNPINAGSIGKLQATRATVTIEDANIRYRVDGTDATASEGHRLTPGDVIYVQGYQAISNFSAIREDGTDATIRVTYER
jgi:hypothetical protein